MLALPVGHINEAASQDCPPQDWGRQDWGCIQTRARRVVLERLGQIGLSNLEQHIKFEVSCTPPDWQSRYNLSKGSNHGLSHNLTQMGYLRPHNRHHRYRNLYFVGASTHPGTGVPTVLVSARLTTERILQEAGVPQLAATRTPAAAW